jgi:hypothetical protein
MITSVFRKSTPLNLFLVVILMLVFFFITVFQDLSWINSAVSIVKIGGLFLISLGSIFIANFVAKKNGLSKDSSFVMFFCFLFLLFFPSVLVNTNLLLSNFFILLALRRLISLQSLKASKEKIFDASLWIFLAALFHFWSILYIILVFISIIFHVARDYRNWVLPFIAFLALAVISVCVSLIFNIDILGYLTENAVLNFDIDYFTNTYQNIAFSIYLTVALFFVISMFASLSSKLLFLLASYKKIIASFFIAIVIFAISPNKSNDLLIYTIAPLSIMATSHIEEKQPLLKQEMVLGVLILCSLFVFFSQL